MVPMLMVACRLMTSGDSGVSSLRLSLDRSCGLSLEPVGTKLVETASEDMLSCCWDGGERGSVGERPQ